MKTLVVLALGPLFAIAADLPVREVTSQAALVANMPVPGFQNGYIFFLDHTNVQLFAPAGYPKFVTVLQIPNAENTSAQGLAIDSDGSAAVSVGYRTADGFGGGIVFLDRYGRQTGFLNTGLYMPSNLSYAEDHSLWSFGWERDPVKPDRATRQDYMMVRKYTPDRKEAGRYLARSLFPKGLEPGGSRWQRLSIAVAKDRVGLLARSGENSSLTEWVELNSDGTLIRRLRLEHGGDPNVNLAFTSDGLLYRQAFGSGQLEVLDRNKPEWKIAEKSPGRKLMGADGALLVFSNTGDGPIGLQWFEQPLSDSANNSTAPSGPNQ